MLKNRLFSTIFFLAFSIICSYAQILEPVKWSITMSEQDKNGNAEITLEAQIDDNWHIYSTEMPEDGPRATSISFDNLTDAELTGSISCESKLERKFEKTFNMELEWYEKKAVFRQKVKVGKNFMIKGHVEYMACDDNTCLPPAKEPFSFGDTAETAVNETTALPVFNFGDKSEKKEKDYWKPVTDNAGNTEEDSTSESIWNIFISGLIGGLIAIITPCVWPIIPMTVSFFLKRGKKPQKGKKAVLTYGLSIILIYVTLGLIITLIFDASALNSLSTNAVFNILLFSLLTLFAISFFGGFELALPATWSTKIDNKADKTAGLFSILLMAFTLVIVSFSCTGPIIGTLLVHVSVGGNIFAPAIGMFGFALALAIPFTLFAFFPSWLHNLPRSGGWLNSVKVLLGFFELAFALKFLSVADLAYGWHILDREIFIALWIVIFSLMGFYLLGKIRFSGDDPIEEVPVPRLFMSILVFSFVIYLIPGMFGAPLKAVSAFTPPMSTQDMNLFGNQVHAQFTDYDEAMKYAEKHKKPVIVDFTGYGCVNCRKMEATVWNNADAKSMLTNDYVLVSLYVDDKTELTDTMIVTENGKEKEITTVGDKWSYLQRHKFGANAQPYYVLLNNDGDLLNAPLAFTESDEVFLNFLSKGLENYKK